MQHQTLQRRCGQEVVCRIHWGWLGVGGGDTGGWGWWGKGDKNVPSPIGKILHTQGYEYMAELLSDELRKAQGVFAQ